MIPIHHGRDAEAACFTFELLKAPFMVKIKVTYFQSSENVKENRKIDAVNCYSIKNWYQII